uniref:UBR-type domain-containing protein n=1 Tax=Macrostomum lignano TaxID=282301 RepID=A0A1I8F683_9PLAT
DGPAAIRRLAGQSVFLRPPPAPPPACRCSAPCCSPEGCRVQLAHLSRCRRRGHRLCNYSFYAHHHCDAFRCGQDRPEGAGLPGLPMLASCSAGPGGCARFLSAAATRSSGQRVSVALGRPGHSGQSWCLLLHALADSAARLLRLASEAPAAIVEAGVAAALRQATGSVLLECPNLPPPPAAQRAETEPPFSLPPPAASAHCLAKPMELLVSLHWLAGLNSDAGHRLSDAAAVSAASSNWLGAVLCKAEFLRLALLAAAAERGLNVVEWLSR